MAAVAKFLAVFGKDIIQEPLRLIDRQIQVYNARKDKEHEQTLKMNEQEFLVELGLREKEMNEKIQQMIDDLELDRDIKLLDAIKRYQQEMAACAVSIGNSLASMNEELKQKAEALALEKKLDYEQMQERAINNASEQLAQINEKFPEGSNARKIMEDAIAKKVNGMIDSSIRFIQIIDDEFIKLMEHIRDIQKQSTININEYLSPAIAKAVAQKMQGRGQTVSYIDTPKQLN